MTARTVRLLPFAALAAVLWLVARHTPSTAQAPPAGTDADKRLQAMEEKLNRLVNKLDPPKVAINKEALAKQIDLLVNAREVLRGELESHEQKHSEFRKNNPHLLYRNAAGSTSVFVERMAKAESERADVRRRLREIGTQTVALRLCLNSEKPTEEAPALVLMLRRRGIDLSKIPGTDEKDAVGQLKVYLRSLQLEDAEQKSLHASAEDEFNNAQNAAREISNYEAEDEKIRSRIVASRQLFDNILKRLQEINLREAD